MATFNKEMCEPLEKVILENGSFLATGFGKPFVWKNNQELWHDGLVGKTAIASIWGCRFKSQRGKH